MEFAPFLGVFLIVSDPKVLAAAKLAKVKNHIVGRTAINIGILELYRKNILGFSRAQEKVEFIVCCMIAV